MAPIRHLYFHIPFCPKLCPYCCFFVEVGAKNKTEAFLDALLHEVRLASEKYDLRPRTIYFGGGTPSALLTGQLEYLFSGLRRVLDFSEVTEFSLEANPATIRPDKATVLRDAGITRLSLGVQSWDDDLLKTLGRVHNSAQAAKTFETLRAAGFDNLNIDLMFAVPGQTEEQWLATLERTISFQPEHVSSYCLTYEEDTEYFRKLTGGQFVQDDERDARLFEQTMERLQGAGYRHYEISNYSRPGHESAHNRAYWQGADYLGFGPSAFSTVGCERWENVRDTAAYIQALKEGTSLIRSTESLSETTRRGEIAAFAMRTAEGLTLHELEPWITDIRHFLDIGLLQETAGRVHLTSRGKLLADAVAEAFV